MIYRFRIILDSKEDILRDIEIEADASLEDFHYAIAQAFGFGGSEMASFYTTNENWEQGEELPLLDMGEETTSMASRPVESFFSADNHHLIYVYNFLALWTFYVELMEVGEKSSGTLYPNLIFAQGEVPEEAPEKQFSAETDDFDLKEEEDDFDDYDPDAFY